MIYPIIAYGNPILKKEAVDLAEGSDLTQLIHDMYATMDFTKGVGLAAPQINQGVRLFVIDSSLMLDEEDEEKERAALAGPREGDIVAPAPEVEEGDMVDEPPKKGGRRRRTIRSKKESRKAKKSAKKSKKASRRTRRR